MNIAQIGVKTKKMKVATLTEEELNQIIEGACDRALAKFQLSRDARQWADLLSRKEAAEFLGVSQPTVDLMMRQGRVERVHVGRRVLIRREDLESIVASKRKRK